MYISDFKLLDFFLGLSIPFCNQTGIKGLLICWFYAETDQIIPNVEKFPLFCWLLYFGIPDHFQV